MRTTASGYRWIAGIMRLLELRHGPFWESEGSPVPTPSAAVLQTGQELESLLCALVDGRKRSLRVFVASLVVGAAAFIATMNATTDLFIFLSLGVVALAALMSTMVPAIWGREWFAPYYGGIIVAPLPPAPPPGEVLDKMRRLSDELAVIGDEAAGSVLQEMREQSPLAFEVCMRTTVARPLLQRRLRGCLTSAST